MRLGLVAGILCLVIGAFLLLRGGHYLEKHDVVRVGDIHVTDTDSHPVPMWVGGAVVVAGIILIAGGARKS